MRITRTNKFNRNLHIGVDATAWLNSRGYGRHARSLLTSLVQSDAENHYTFICDSQEVFDQLPSDAERRLVQTDVPNAIAASASSHRSLGDMRLMSQALSDPNFDLLLFPTVYSYVPVLSRAIKVLMIHDIIPEKFPQLTIPKRFPRLLWRIKSALGRWQADAIVTVSEYSRQCLADHFNIPIEKVFVVGEASDPIFKVIDNPQTDQLASIDISKGDRLIIYVGGFGPHKNLDGLVEEFGRLAGQKEYSDVHLVMVGEYKQEVFHSQYEIIKRKIDDLGIAKRVIFTGYLPDDELVLLLNLATVLVLPSFMEGFGLPAVEAAACGCPVIATTESPLPSLLGEAGLYVNPYVPEELEQALIRVLQSEELRRNMRISGLQAASSLSWGAAAIQMIEVFHKLTLNEAPA